MADDGCEAAETSGLRALIGSGLSSVCVCVCVLQRGQIQTLTIGVQQGLLSPSAPPIL